MAAKPTNGNGENHFDPKKDPRYCNIIKGKSSIHAYAEENDLYSKIPNYKIKKLMLDKPPVTIIGPYNAKVAPATFGHAFGTTISTYPWYSGKSSREGDPICDSYRMQTYRNGCIICVADGCGWGERAKEASNRLKDSFVMYFVEKDRNLKTTREIATHLINSLAIAHFSIYYDKTDMWMAGTSTAIGGLLVEIAEPESAGLAPWAFVAVTIGDCKCFKYCAANKEVIDVTPGNRLNITDPRDPGGRLGPYNKQGEPDLRNLELLYIPCNRGDIFIVVSDGVHDNLDPQTLGFSPAQLGLEGEKWSDVDVALGTAAKTKHMNQLLTQLVNDVKEDLSPARITKALIKHSRTTTGISRQWMEQHPNQMLENDYTKFPGKLDHTTCAAFLVGRHDPTQDDTTPKSFSLQPEVWPWG